MLWLIHTYNVMLPHSAECAAANRLLAERGEWGAEEGGRSWSCCPRGSAVRGGGRAARILDSRTSVFGRGGL